ncbi:Pacifastin domain [Sergentomyia squamirostris]
MRKFLLLLTVLLCVEFINADDDNKQQCEPGSTFNIVCNRCKCSNDGTRYWCTRMACVDFHKVSRRQTQEEPTPSTEEVKTEEARPAEPKPDDHVAEVAPENGHVCTPGDVKHEDCNRCKCANNGIGWWCTRNECPSGPSQPRTRRHPRIP